MKSKTFCFNKTIFKKNMTHFWPLWALYTCYLIFVLPVSLWLNMQSYAHMEGYVQSQKQMLAVAETMCIALNQIPTFIFAAAAIMAVFSYLYSPRNTNMIHSLPVNRLELFTTNFCSAAAFMVFPQILTFIITVFVCIASHITKIEYILFWFGAALGVTFFALALGVFVAMFTGQLLAFPFYYGIVNYLYVGCMFLMDMLIQTICFGVSDSWNPGKSCILSPIYYLNNNLRINELRDTKYETTGIEFTGGSLVIIYALAGAVFLLAAYQLYKKRQLEVAGDLLSMKKIRPIFRWGVGICVGTGLGMLFTDVIKTKSMGDKGTFLLLLFSVLLIEAVAFFAAEMLIEKNFRIFNKKMMAEWGILAIFSVAFLGIFKADVFHIEGKVPEVSEVKSVVVDMDYRIRYVSEEDIAKVIDIQKKILENKQECMTAENYYTVQIQYRLNNGKRLSRIYPIPAAKEDVENKDSVLWSIIALESNPENMAGDIFGRNYKNNEYYAGDIAFTDESGREEEYRFSEEELQEIVSAVMADIEEGNMNEYQLYALSSSDETADYDSRYYNTLLLNFYNPGGVIWSYSSYYVDDVDVTEEVLEGVPQEKGGWVHLETNGSAYINFGSKCTHIIQTLEKLGIVNAERKLLTYEEYDALTGDTMQ